MKAMNHGTLVIENLESRQMLDARSLLISEIMYNPAITNEERAAGLKDRDFEFIELRNASNSSVSLQGISLDEAITFSFGQITLSAGQALVVVHNREAFESRYGAGPHIAGQYDGTLGNGGDQIVIKDSMNVTILDFVFDDAWYSTTDGDGFSLTVADGGSRLVNPNRATSWKPSSRVGGSPGYDDGDDDPRPRALMATELTSRRMAIQWKSPTEGGMGGQEYRLYRDGQFLGGSHDTFYTDSTVVPGGVYSYQVAIIDDEEIEHLSNPVKARIESVGGDLKFEQGVSHGKVGINKLKELSGLVASRQNQDVFWTHNDGPQTTVIAIGLQGEYLGDLQLEGVQPHDWEDIAIGPGPDAGVDYLYVGDIGGKKPKRNVIQVFRVPEPVVSESTQVQRVASSDYATITLQYPEGKEFNAETLLVDPLTGDLFVIPKQGNDTPVHRAAVSALTSGATIMLKLVARLNFPSISGGDISPTGSEILIRSEDFAQLFHRGEGQTVVDALLSQPVNVPVIGRPIEPNGEAIAFDGDGRDYLTISEGINPPLYSYARVPTAHAGDANRDLRFDQVDIIMALRGGKFRTEEPATWSEGDWNGDGVFDNLDVVAALQTGNYLRGRYIH